MDDTSIKGYVVEARDKIADGTRWRPIVPAILRSWPVVAEDRVVAIRVVAETEEGRLVREIRATSTEIQAVVVTLPGGVESKTPGILWFYGKGSKPLGFLPSANASAVCSELARMAPRFGPS